MRIPEGYDVYIISSTVSLDDIPETITCSFCGAPTIKGYTEHGCQSNNTLIVNPESAGYLCTNEIECGASFLSEQAHFENLLFALILLQGEDYRDFRTIVNDKIRSLVSKNELDS